MNVKFHNPDFPEGMEFDLGGLILLNGMTKELTKEEIRAYEVRNGRSLEDVLLSNEFGTYGKKQGSVTYTPTGVDDNEPENLEEGDN